MKNHLLIIAGFLLLVSGCGRNEPDLGPPDEEFVGTYLVRDLTDTEHEALEDSIIFSVLKNTTYNMTVYPLISGGDTKMCDNSGTILDFGTGKASFDPTFIASNNCQNRSPMGTFAADFINNQGEIHITRSVQGYDSTQVYFDSLYLIILKQ